MSMIVVSVHTMENVATVQLKYDDDYVVENSKWSEGKSGFPYRALLRGACRILKLRVKKWYPSFVESIKNKLIN